MEIQLERASLVRYNHIAIYPHNLATQKGGIGGMLKDENFDEFGEWVDPVNESVA